MAATETTPRKGREGSRWFNERPKASEFAEWFSTVPIHDGLKHADFVGGVTLIQQKEKIDEVVGWNGATPVLGQRENLVYIPHPQVMARVAYFRALRDLHEADWTCVVEPQDVGEGVGLPPGYFRYAALQSTGTQAFFVGCSLRVRIFEKGTTTWCNMIGGRRVLEGKLIFEGSPGSKIVPVLKSSGWADPNALMRAESGALGRALGMAGMLVIPGSGVATAEDVQEAIAQPVELPGVTASALVSSAPKPSVRDVFEQLVAELATTDATARATFDEWTAFRGIDPAKATEAELRTLIMKLEQILERLKAQA